MTNTELLDAKIQESGKKIKYLADKCGMSVQTFRRCRKNLSEFRTSHINVLCAELSITKLSEKEAIFYSRNGA